MNFFRFGNTKKVDSGNTKKSSSRSRTQEAAAFYGGDIGNGSLGNPVTYLLYAYTGEKNPGELGTAKKYIANYRALRTRAWQLYMDSDIPTAIIDKFKRWVVGTGLNLQSEPVNQLLELTGDQIDSDQQKMIEVRWSLFAKSKRASYDGEMDLHETAEEIVKNAKIGGDCLVILKQENFDIKVQVIDADHVMSPSVGAKELTEIEKRGNRVLHGVELNKKDEHVAYWVFDSNQKFIRVKAKNAFGNRIAFLVYGKRYRKNDVRGISVFSAGMESIRKIDRFKEASISGAEQRAKIPITIEHSDNSIGENPLESVVRNSLPTNSKVEGSEFDHRQEGINSAQKIASTTPNTALNLPPGAKMNYPNNSQAETSYKDFLEPNLQLFCASIGIPYEVAISIFNGSYSASRAALKDWENTLDIDRKWIASSFYQRVYELWLVMQDAIGTIPIESISDANKNDKIKFEAITNARYIGVNIPHIDPVKEATASRILLGENGKHIPLTTVKRETEELGKGDSEINVEKFSQELSSSPEPLNIPAIPDISDLDDDEENSAED